MLVDPYGADPNPNTIPSSCEDPIWFKLNVSDGSVVSGTTYTTANGGEVVQGTVSDFAVTIYTKIVGEKKYFAFESNYPVMAVFAKGGNKIGNLFLYYPTYPNGVTTDCGLSMPGGGWSHITFYYCERMPDARISIASDGVNLVGVTHPISAFVEVFNGVIWLPAPDGTTVSFNTSFGDLSALSATTIDGYASVNLDSDSAGVSIVNASTTLEYMGHLFTRSTDGLLNNSGPVTKTWWDLKIAITPNGTNAVGTPHNLTATAMIKIGNADWVAVADDTSIGFSTNFGTLDAASSLTTGGVATNVLNSMTAGVSTVNASVTYSYMSQSLTRTTDGLLNNSEPVTKTWWDARISIGPDGCNPVGEPHEFTALVEMTTDGITWSPVNGVTVNFTNDFGTPLTGSAITDINGMATFTIVSYMAGTSTVNANATVNYEMENLYVATDGYGAYSGPAIKDWYEPESDTIWAKLVDVNGSEDPNAIGFKGTGNWGWYNGPLSEGSYTFELWAGAAKNDTSRGQLAGYLYLTYADGCVSYTTTLEPGFTAKEGAHVYISYDSDAPDFRKDFDDADFACDSLCGFSGEIYFAFHSSVYLPYID